MYESGSKWNCSPTCTTVCRRTLTGMTIAAARVFHVNVNCSDLERSLAFYRAVGLTPATRTRPEGPQAGAAFGLDQAWWDARILQGDAGYAAPVVDLLQWP